MNVLLQGVVGSTAYGLAREGSDVDRLGMFAAPTTAFHGLAMPKDSHVTTAPDVTLHEVAKLARLALTSNPTATELLWLDYYEVCTPLAEELVGIRRSLAAAPRVRSAFLGYATQQFKRLEARGDGSFSADTRKRTAKHARHLARLVRSGLMFYVSGELTVRVDSPQWYWDFGDAVANGHIDLARQVMSEAEDDFNGVKSQLPDGPDTAAVEAWLLRVRAHYYEKEEA